MKHNISYDDWLAYLDGELDAGATNRIRRHINACAECRVVWHELLTATAALRAAADDLVTASQPSSTHRSISRDRVLARIRASESSTAVEAFACGELTVGRLRRLQLVVAPACGVHTAFRLIVAAVGRTSSPHSAEAWQRFLKNLTHLTSALCGKSMARLVWEIGVSLP